MKYKYQDGLIFDTEDGQRIAELCDNATPEQGQLLASAPRLLAVLEKLVGLINYAASDERSLQGDNWGEYEQEHLPAIREVLAEANGE